MVKDWLSLRLLSGVTMQQKRALVNHFGSPGEALGANSSALVQVDTMTPKALNALREKQKLDSSSSDSPADAQYQQLLKAGVSYLGFTDPAFPFLLNQIPQPPLGLFVKGNIELLQSPQIAVVGSRNPGPSGRRTTLAFARNLSTMGLTITSGMACGIDSDAHRGCLTGDHKQKHLPRC